MGRFEGIGRSVVLWSFILLLGLLAWSECAAEAASFAK
jgi:hypothetical protein